jgi:pyrophosphatase PpaX
MNRIFNNLKTVLLDLDGTLLDSFSVHLEVFKTTFAKFGIQLSEEDFLSNYSPNWYKTYEALGLRKEDWAPADAFWLKEVENKTALLFPGVIESLLTLNKNYSLGLVTSGSKVRVERDLKATGIHHFFKTVITGDDIKTPKPSPEGLQLALNKLESKADEAIYIGDTIADYEMAKAAGVFFIGVNSEFRSLINNHPDYLVNSIADLPKVMGIR